MLEDAVVQKYLSLRNQFESVAYIEWTHSSFLNFHTDWFIGFKSDLRLKYISQELWRVFEALAISLDGTISPFTADTANSKIVKFSKITNWLKLKNKQHHNKVSLNSFPMNGKSFIEETRMTYYNMAGKTGLSTKFPITSTLLK